MDHVDIIRSVYTKKADTYHFVVWQAEWDYVALVDDDGPDVDNQAEIPDETNRFHWWRMADGILEAV